MANSTLPDIASMDVKSQIYLVRENFIQPTGLLQIAVIGVTYLIARIIYTKIRQHLEKDSEKVKSHARFALSPAQFAIILGYVLWLLLLWFCRVLFEELQMPSDLLRMAVNLAMAWLFLRFASFYIKSTFWSRLVYIIIIVSLALKIFRLWEPTVALLGSMTIELGSINVSILGLIEAAVLFICLWIAAGAVNRFMAHRLATSERLTSSDRVLFPKGHQGC